MSISNQVLVIFLCFALSFLFIRGFIYGIIRYLLNTNAYKKKKKNQSPKEWFLYSRYKNEIPKFFLALYIIVLLVHVLGLGVCVVLWVKCSQQNVGEVITKIIAFFDVSWIIMISLLFWSPRRKFAYERWIKKKK